MSKPKHPKHPGGRPTKYLPDYHPQALKDYFNVDPCNFKDMEVTTTNVRDGKIITQAKTVEEANNLPFFFQFCKFVGITQETMLQWVKKYPMFSEAYTYAKDKQREILVTNGLRGNYDSRFAIFTAKNIIGWRDRTEIEHKGKVLLIDE